jgi:hypothetical protein
MRCAYRRLSLLKMLNYSNNNTVIIITDGGENAPGQCVCGDDGDPVRRHHCSVSGRGCSWKCYMAVVTR